MDTYHLKPLVKAMRLPATPIPEPRDETNEVAIQAWASAEGLDWVPEMYYDLTLRLTPGDWIVKNWAGHEIMTNAQFTKQAVLIP